MHYFGELLVWITFLQLAASHRTIESIAQISTKLQNYKITKLRNDFIKNKIIDWFWSPFKLWETAAKLRERFENAHSMWVINETGARLALRKTTCSN
jgi:hypothetical protein